MPASRPSSVDRLSLGQARRVALRAQGLDRSPHARDAVSLPDPRPSPSTQSTQSTQSPQSPQSTVTMRHVQQVVDRLGVLQIDSVNVVARAHLVPVFSRMGPYDTALIDRAGGQATARAPRRLVEAWAHEASYVAPETWALLGWRRRAYLDQAWGSIRSVPRAHPEVLAQVRSFVTAHGPVTARQVHDALAHEHPGRTSWGWNWTLAKLALEFLFFTGEVNVACRTSTFERAYDLTERVLPPGVLARPEPDEADARRALVEIAARAHGIGTTACFADYFRMGVRRAEPAVRDLVADGVLRPVEVSGWDRPTYLHRDAVVPRRVAGRALLSPFDPLVFERRRLEALFGMRYRIEIYTPQPRRVHGYYVLPFLLGERMAARVDLKADRAAGVLRVLAAFAEPDPPPGTTDELAAELRLMARWLGLETVRVDAAARGDLAGSLGARVGGLASRGHGSPTMDNGLR